MTPKVVLVANCQARPIATLLNQNYEVEITDKIIVHLAKDNDFERYEQKLESADYIISQFINKTYPCEFVRTQNMQEKFQNKLILIPNLYYRGYTPDLRYIRIKGKPTLDGPLGDYHSQTIFNAWAKGDDPIATLKTYNSTDHWEQNYCDIASESLQDLQKREENLDICISDYINRMKSSEQLFFTFNHPSRPLLDELIRRIAKKMELNVTSSIPNQQYEPLGRFQAPIHPFVKASLQLKFEGPTVFQGNNRDKTIKKPAQFSTIEIIENFFDHYNARKGDILELGVNIQKVV